jgi:dienelactone hydrolase
VATLNLSRLGRREGVALAGSVAGNNVLPEEVVEEITMVVSNNSRELGSIQCASSKIMSTGCCWTSTSSWPTSASMVFCFFCLALKFNGG